MDHLLNEIKPFIIHLSENDDVNDNWDEMEQISWYLSIIWELFRNDMLNTIKRVRNGHLLFLKEGLQKPGVPPDSIFLWTGSIIFSFPQIRLRWTDFLFSVKRPQVTFLQCMQQFSTFFAWSYFFKKFRSILLIFLP